MAAELVSLKVDVLVTWATRLHPMLKTPPQRFPIVFVFVSDPVGATLVDSLARPGGNATGLSNFATDLIAKRIELLKEIMPGQSYPEPAIASVTPRCSHAADSRGRLPLRDQRRTFDVVGNSFTS